MDNLTKTFKAIEESRHKKIEDTIAELIYLFGLSEVELQDLIDTYLLKAQDPTVPLTKYELAKLKRDINRIKKELQEEDLEFDKDIKDKIKALGLTTTQSQALKLRVAVTLNQLYNTAGKHVYSCMEDITRDMYTETSKAVGEDKEIEDFLLFELLKEVWRSTGEKFDDVVWRYGRASIYEVQQALSRAETFGMDLPDIPAFMRRKSGELANLVRTDSTYFATRSEQEALKKSGIEEVVFTAVIDDRTSDMCLEADGTVIPVDDIRPWENAPPLHYCCRSTLTPITGKGE